MKLLKNFRTFIRRLVFKARGSEKVHLPRTSPSPQGIEQICGTCAFSRGSEVGRILICFTDMDNERYVDYNGTCDYWRKEDD